MTIMWNGCRQVSHVRCISKQRIHLPIARTDTEHEQIHFKQGQFRLSNNLCFTVECSKTEVFDSGT